MSDEGDPDWKRLPDGRWQLRPEVVEERQREAMEREENLTAREAAFRAIDEFIGEIDRAAAQLGDDELHKLVVIYGKALHDKTARESWYQAIETEKARRRGEKPKGKVGGAAPQARQLAQLVKQWMSEADIDETGRRFLNALLGGSFDLLRNRCPLAPKHGLGRWKDEYEQAEKLVCEAMRKQADPNDSRRDPQKVSAAELFVVAGMKALGADDKPTRKLFE